MALYTLQFITESGSFSAPCGDDVEHCRNLKQLKAALEYWDSEVQALSEYRGEALVWYGRHPDVTDIYPDALATIGPRGGLHLRRI